MIITLKTLLQQTFTIDVDESLTVSTHQKQWICPSSLVRGSLQFCCITTRTHTRASTPDDEKSFFMPPYSCNSPQRHFVLQVKELKKRVHEDRGADFPAESLNLIYSGTCRGRTDPKEPQNNVFLFPFARRCYHEGRGTDQGLQD